MQVVLLYTRKVRVSYYNGACESMNFGELYRRAKEAAEIDNLYNTWCIAYSQYNSDKEKSAHR